MTVQYNRLRVGALPLPDSQLRIIAEHGADTYQDAIMETAQLVCQTHGFLATKSQRFTAACRNAAIPALRVGKRNEGSIVSVKIRSAGL